MWSGPIAYIYVPAINGVRGVLFLSMMKSISSQPSAGRLATKIAPDLSQPLGNVNTDIAVLLIHCVAHHDPSCSLGLGNISHSIESHPQPPRVLMHDGPQFHGTAAWFGKI